MQTLGMAQYGSWQTVTPSDTTRVSFRAIYVGGAGNVALSPDGTTAATTFTAVPVGSILYMSADQGRIMATNTTATLLIALS
jgi:hypothetical protein